MPSDKPDDSFNVSLPNNEHERFEELKIPGNTFDAVTTLASQVCNIPVSYVDLIDGDQQCIKSCHGASIDDMPLRQGLSEYTLMTYGICEIHDLKKDSRYQDKPNVTGEPHFRFYAGTPLLSDRGNAIGTLSVVDFKKNKLTDIQKQHLRALADIVSDQLRLLKRNKILETTGLFNKRLIKVVSHDIRSPLTGIIGAADFLMEDELSEDDKTELIQIITEGAGQIQNILSKLLDSELLQFGKSKAIPDSYDVVDGLDAIIQQFTYSAHHKEITLKYDFDGDIPTVMIDGQYCERILANLISSAIKFTNRGGKVHIRCHYKENDKGVNNLVMTVKDTGIGMTERQLRHLSDDYQEEGTFDLDEESSYGLRMYIVKKLCEVCHADVHATSELDKGTVITVELPAPRKENNNP